MSRRWNRSTIPLDWGWKAVVEAWRMPRVEQSWDQMAEVNWAPRSEVKVAGTPKREIQPWKRAEAQLEAVMSASG